MATLSQWVEGARPKTLPAAVAPVLVGSGAAAALASFNAADAVLALLVSLALQVGVNYANDYSDGIRGTDADRVGPVRLVGQRLATPGNVKLAAMASFAAAALFGLALVALSEAWVLLWVGAAAIVAAWYYTGGKRPYGYAGLGEVFVFVFFGLVAVLGTTYTQAHELSAAAWAGAVGIGAIAAAILVANNLRDIPGDTVSGKRTLAVRLGDHRTRTLYAGLLAVAFVGVVVAGLSSAWPALIALASFALAVPLVRRVWGGARGRDLVPVLAGTGRFELVYAALLALGLALA
ncbi:1,4-dihydroxy-2-naphthoate polyprenyltransferase [Oryzihumus sp.]|uniref:1,4-dihydroxy-2-naphthoate polyprenyltransferase n=1 Tax=Oryzihumus sp. TaxID=1968903 RepID=UPI002ED8EBD2